MNSIERKPSRWENLTSLLKILAITGAIGLAVWLIDKSVS